jgi:hypothetical protein
MQAVQLLQQVQIQETKNLNKYNLWWENPKTNKKFSAGRAFYNEDKGDFCLLINLLESSAKDSKRDEYYLRPAQVTEDCIYFRLEKVIHKKDRSHRFCIGEGFQSKTTNGDIHIHIEPLTSFSKKLVLSMNQEKEKSNE